MSKLQKAVKGTFNSTVWASKFFNATEDVITVAKE